MTHVFDPAGAISRESRFAMAEPKKPLLADHPTFDPSKVWVLLWSQQAKVLHIETLARMLTSHWEAFRDDRDLKYIPLAVGDREVVERHAEMVAPVMEARYEAWRAGRPEIPAYGAQY